MKSVLPKKASNRVVALDVLRGVAILLVMFRHSVLNPAEAGALMPFAQLTHRFGWAGVDLFFVLSGFLIGGLLFAEIRDRGSLHLRRFFVRRSLRIYPAYLLFLAYAYVYMLRHWQVNAGHAFHILLPNFLHIQNYILTPQTQTWTLAVEEHFYLALPILLVGLLKMGRLTALPWVGLGVILACNALRLLNIGRPYMMALQMTPTHLRVDGLFFGVLLAWLQYFRPEALAPMQRRYRLTFVLGAALLTPMMFIEPTHPFVWTVGYTMLYVGFGCMLVSLISIPVGHGRTGRFLAGRACRLLAFIGVYSYSIYLWHFALVWEAFTFRLRNRGFLQGLPPTYRWLTAMALYIAASILAGVVMATISERPVLAIRERFFPRRDERTKYRREIDSAHPGNGLRDLVVVPCPS